MNTFETTNTSTRQSRPAVGSLLYTQRRGGRLTALWVEATWSYGGERFVEILACYDEAPGKRVKIPALDLADTLADIAGEVDHYYEVTDRSDREHGYPVTG